jgi:APA family basic amino acid/polyamine antiporter
MASCWGFIGVECATAPAGAVENPSKTIPRAIILGTCGVALVYVVSSLSVMGAVPSDILAASRSPYVDAINLSFGANFSKIVSLVTFIIMVGTSNAWTLSASQVSLGLAEDGLLPKIFAKTNRNKAPYISVLASSVGIIPIMILSTSPNLAEQIGGIIDFSVNAFLMVYGICCMAFMKICLDSGKIFKAVLGAIALLFCAVIIANSDLQATVVSLLLTVSGVLVLPFVNLGSKAKAIAKA